MLLILILFFCWLLFAGKEALTHGTARERGVFLLALFVLCWSMIDVLAQYIFNVS
ncbi:hypothetical protein [Photobacterium leiognathi]|uniref:hypothetical protein n=1 Tax=Photobacterium leiognathi TaxID=553611 RepID=UPI0029818F26|nr:hypothetical protein [Photobacterium leiognathi]